MKKYILTEAELKSLTLRATKWDYHEWAGVDNWIGSGYAYEMLEEEGYEDYEAAAADLMKNYTQEVKGE